MTIKAIPSPLTLKPTKLNQEKLNDLRSKVGQLYEQASKIRNEVEGFIGKLEDIKPLLD